MVTDIDPKLRQAFDDMTTSRVKRNAVAAVDNVNSVTPNLQLQYRQLASMLVSRLYLTFVLLRLLQQRSLLQ